MLKLSTLILSTIVILKSSSVLMTSASLGETFTQCISIDHLQPNLTECFGFSAINELRNLDSNFDNGLDLIDGLTMLKRPSNPEFREETMYNFAKQDYSDYRSIINTFDHVFSKRAMRWDMSFFYPGLAMKISPLISPPGLLEFVMDESLARVKDIGTGKILARQFLLPLLLGVKFKIASLIPIFFGIMVLIAKKLVFISKLALIVSSAFGLGSLLFSFGGHHHQYAHHHQEPFNNNNNNNNNNYHYANQHQYHYPNVFEHSKSEEDNNNYSPIYAAPAQSLLQYEGVGRKNLQEDTMYIRLPSVPQSKANNEAKEGRRNFAWNEDEKKLNESKRRIDHL